MIESLEIIYQDEYMVAVNKPHGLLVHRTKLATEADEFALQILRDQLKQKVYPVHRIDRKTSGILLFALDQETEKLLNALFAAQAIKKEYLAIVRGYIPDDGTIDYPLKKENGRLQEAVTHYKTLSRTEIDVPLGQHATSRYSLVEVKPETGRMHQIRKHLAHINYPIIGDRPHGCNKQNKLFKERWEMDKMMLHASKMQLQHPINRREITIEAKISEEFQRTLKFLTFEGVDILETKIS
ncbi:tRNA pseudouridine(65) synthase TruC [Marivirga lumbricoides]|uniref:tRNA pseudouridine synthase C n=1 Tax=Marivirga lumbricoides TaxID=1046115 RepID=A0A2T4DFI4_9BACT|nr:pseudouridylate synthase [Marivirga lumbricoides]GGC44404.1 tRNA pseudouridine(65) synthase TruC [Marivirga lumbricoides]